ncbi:SDR family NAD(P)-dependent oxidoreductase [Pseudoxanthomonas suwonensis]|uniref:Short-chain dehydrogenase n=1 Tax=Pseudoxanthomonas suwonensis TaxID=314722 RepID=A0A0E3Z2L5_9GAMM|nr:SDR family NAD(P)-dependent oxidoreductase [Pseudoxanthomonas suwonensis]AKC87519.1 short-chain dehydrogenase [Pseudoxanthomonas suwonensis]
MKDFEGKVAFVTGGASGIGLALGEAFGRLGMKVMLADVEAGALDKAVARLKAQGVAAAGVICDVSRRDAVQAAADATLAAFGKIHIVCNNAGVSVTGRIGELRPRDWDWILDINLKGVIHGTEVFTPLIERHGEGGHFVNTASMGGMISAPTHEPYTATKFAVIGMSEGWAGQLSARGIGVTVLCPAFVRTRIAESRRNQPGAGAGEPVNAAAKAAVEAGMAPEVVAGMAIEAIRATELYVFTHPEFETVVRERFDRILAAFERARLSPFLSGPGSVT